MWFEAMSRLKVNLDKSEIISVGRVENVEGLALEFGCKVSKLSSSYLGLPLGARFKEVAVWDEVEERLRKRLSFGKKVVYLQRGQTDFDSEHSVQYAYLLYVPVLYAKECEFEIGADQKGLSLGWWGLREEAPFSGLVYCLLR